MCIGDLVSFEQFANDIVDPPLASHLSDIISASVTNLINTTRKKPLRWQFYGRKHQKIALE